jgi:DNA mismatch repair protein MutS
MSLVNEYFELTKKYQDEYGENTLLLMQVGAFFEVYGMRVSEKIPINGSKIIDFSQICELNIVEKNTCIPKRSDQKKGDSSSIQIVMAGFKDFQIDKYIKKLQEAGFTVVVYVQDEAAKNTTRSLGGVFSPGTYFHTDSNQLSNSIACIWVDLVENRILTKGKFVVVGVANIDIYTGKTSMFQFKEPYVNNPTTYDELERFVSIHNPNEVIFISNLPSEKEMDAVISYAAIRFRWIRSLLQRR